MAKPRQKSSGTAAQGAIHAYRLIREEKLQRAEARIATRRLHEVLTASTAIDADALRVELNALAARQVDDRAWTTTVEPLLVKLAGANHDEQWGYVATIVKKLVSTLDLRLDLPDDGDLVAALADPTTPLALRRPRRQRNPEPPDDRMLERLGQRADPPAGIDPAQITAAVASRTDLEEPPRAGQQVVRAGALGPLYDHHGIILGDGTVVHFAGEPGATANARIERTWFSKFAGPGGTTHVDQLEPESVRGRPVVTLRGAITCLRALSRVGAKNYNVLGNNCEHFANWALLGASYSAQTRLAGQAERLARKDPKLAAVLTELIGDDVTFRRGAYATSGGQERMDDPLWFDLGRAYWSPLNEDVVAWIPIWKDGPPLAAADHQWRLGGLRGKIVASSWTATCPAPLVESDWHASLVAVVSGAWQHEPGTRRFYWVTQDGVWREEPITLADLLDARLAHAEALFDALGKSALETLHAIIDDVR